LPTYQYACSACQHEFEVFQAFSESSLTHCPECNGELRKVYSAVGVVFKGSGFYKTDSKSDTKTATPVVKESTVKATTTESVAPVKSPE
jgi:putative FmdB family regulatory protein